MIGAVTNSYANRVIRELQIANYGVKSEEMIIFLILRSSKERWRGGGRQVEHETHIQFINFKR